jgi:hypothetical protein
MQRKHPARPHGGAIRHRVLRGAGAPEDRDGYCKVQAENLIPVAGESVNVDRSPGKIRRMLRRIASVPGVWTARPEGARGRQTFGHQLLLGHRLELVGIARWPTFALPDSKSSLTNLLLPCLIYGRLLQA